MKGKKYPCYIGANRHHTLGGVHVECLPCPIKGNCPPSIINPFTLCEPCQDYPHCFNCERCFTWVIFWQRIAGEVPQYLGEHKDSQNIPYDADPAEPWTDPISGEVDYAAMEEDLGVSCRGDPYDGEDFDY